jgi:hypothetical protein
MLRRDQIRRILYVKTVGTPFMASGNSLRDIRGRNPGKVPRGSPNVDEETGVQWCTIPLNELPDAINGVPTVFTRSSS